MPQFINQMQAFEGLLAKIDLDVAELFGNERYCFHNLHIGGVYDPLSTLLRVEMLT